MFCCYSSQTVTEGIDYYIYTVLADYYRRQTFIELLTFLWCNYENGFFLVADSNVCYNRELMVLLKPHNVHYAYFYYGLKSFSFVASGSNLQGH